MTALDTPRKIRKAPKKVPENLIYEIMDGKPVYYKGYRQVLSGEKSIVEIMGSSSLQALIVFYLSAFIGKFIDEEMYTVLINEAGLHIDHKNNLANDIAIFEQTVLTPDKISRKYASVPPKIALEIDIDADVESMTETGYIYKKTQKMLDFGTQKVFWILTEAQVVMIATPERIETLHWNQEIELMEDNKFNIGAYLSKKGVIVN
ncbi:Uma2 family endonuclease [Runella salmonicolor]|uniref:Uma2 family endonuclease n=1 Tax=Runella salmonicolor TaxID=2950278 RepID=A0ABT1FH12_9BACT|nr:Uma2 family endonuclease [Runella salmonicolor]MCP1381034.1 Uma2 family endonuclease [Runella salmonicolor]